MKITSICDLAYTLGIGDRLASYTGGAYTHNAAGCATSIDRTGKPDLALTWNGQYQLTSVSTNGVVAESYAYDPLGRRASTTSGGVTFRHVYDGVHCAADIDAAGAVVRSYTWGPGIDNLLAVTCHSGSSATTYYALTDVQGTVHGFADAGGNLVESYAYDAWGNVLAVRDASGLPIQNLKSQIGNRFLFQGREYSHASGLYNFRLRWYDPATGRWLSKDTIGISGGLNLYAFCGNDPVNYVDPWGLREEGEQALSWAKSEVGNESYSGTGNLPGPFGPGDPKCNIFVAHAYNKGNGKTIIPTGFWGSRPPKARDWFTNNVPPGFTLTTTPRPGDVISDGHHMGLVSEHGKSTVSAATALGVVENSWGYRTNSRPNVYYHYDGGR